MKSDYLKFIRVWDTTSKEDKPENDNRLYDLLKNEDFSKFLVEKINDKSISSKFMPNNPTNSNLPFLLYFCVYYKEFNCPSEDFYVAYLFDKDLSKVFLTLVLGSTNNADINLDFYSEKNSLEQNKLGFKEYIDNYQSEISSKLNIDLENYNEDIFLGRFTKEDVSSPSNQNSKAKKYENGSIYVKSYEIDDLPSENELIEDFNNFINLYNFILKKLFKDDDAGEDKIGFHEALNLIKKTLKDNGTIIDENYDMLLVKKLISEDIINKDNDSKEKITNIVLTGEKMDIFPFLESFDYFYNKNVENGANSEMRFLLEVPVYLYPSNLGYLRKSTVFDFNDEKILTNASVVRYRKDDENWTWELFKKQIDDLKDNSYERRMKLLGYEVQAELSSNYSGIDYVNFCELLYENYFLIILKHENEFKYDIFAVLPKDGEELSAINFELFSLENKTATLVSSSCWSTENQLNEKSSHPLWSKNSDVEDIIDGGKNVLYYGVPGSGKSFTIEDEYFNDESNIERVVFHPDYTYSDFIGQILPKTSNGNVSYDFIEGPFTSILMKACANPNKKFYLIIEEINRGNAPAIFGDVFQLLDRRTTPSDGFPIGTSEYAISNFAIADKVYGNENHKIRIPSNLSIIASMNTADQNVFTLDTAFQRRWDMRLIPNKFDENHEFANKKILDSTVSWKDFVTTINDLILKKNTLITSSEDKRLGVYFIKKEDLSDENKFSEKVLKYLWDDAFKFSRDKIFINDCKSLEDVIDRFKSSKGNERFNIFIDNKFLTPHITNGEDIE